MRLTFLDEMALRRKSIHAARRAEYAMEQLVAGAKHTQQATQPREVQLQACFSDGIHPCTCVCCATTGATNTVQGALWFVVKKGTCNKLRMQKNACARCLGPCQTEAL